MDYFDRDRKEFNLDESEIEHLLAEDTSKFNRYMPWVIRGILATILLTMVGLYFFRGNYEQTDLASLPVVKADNAPVKIKPTDPGGMVVPDMDKTVYNNISSKLEKEHNSEVKILPPAEEPIAREQILPEEHKETEENKTIETADSQSVQPEVKENPVVAEEEKKEEPVVTKAEEQLSQKQEEAKPVATDQNEVRVKKQAEVKQAEVKQDAIEPEAQAAKEVAPKKQNLAKLLPKEEELDKSNIKKQKAKELQQLAELGFATETEVKQGKMMSGGAARIQLASFRLEVDAINEWNRLRKKYSDILAKYSPNIEKKYSEEKGTYYRVQLTIQSENEAKQICKKLQSQRQSCLVMKSKGKKD